MSKKTFIAIATFAVAPALGACDSSLTSPELTPAEVTSQVEAETRDKGVATHSSQRGIGTTPGGSNNGHEPGIGTTPGGNNNRRERGIGTTPGPRNKGIIVNGNGG